MISQPFNEKLAERTIAPSDILGQCQQCQCHHDDESALDALQHRTRDFRSPVPLRGTDSYSAPCLQTVDSDDMIRVCTSKVTTTHKLLLFLLTLILFLDFCNEGSEGDRTTSSKVRYNSRKQDLYDEDFGLRIAAPGHIGGEHVDGSQTG